MKDSLDILLTEPVYVAHDSLDILDPNVICHHGILGMKWGIRRYQNKDGSLTAAGKKRYYFDEMNYEKGWSWGGGNLTKKGEKAFKNRKGEWKNTPAAQKAKEHEELGKRLKAEQDAKVAKAVEYINGDYEKDLSRMNNVTKQDLENAADLGLRTLAVSDSHHLAASEAKKTYDNNDRMWFMDEDQTIGLGEVATMIEKGYTAKEINGILSKLDGASQYDAEPKSKFGNKLLFSQREGRGLSDFAQQCENVKYLDNNGYEAKIEAPGKSYEWTEFEKQTPKYKFTTSGDVLKYQSVKENEKNFVKNADAILKECGEKFYNDYKHWMVDDDAGKDIPKETVIKNLLKEKPSVDVGNQTIWLWSPDAQHYVELECDFKDKKVHQVSLQG